MIAGDSLRQALQLGRAAEELEAIFTDLGRAVTGFSAALRHGLLRLAGGPASEPASEDEMLQRCLAMSLGKPSEAPSTKPPPQLAESFLALMTQHLERLRGHDGLGVLPYLQLLHLLATSPRCGYASPRWVRLADAVLAIITGYEEQMGTGDALFRLKPSACQPMARGSSVTGPTRMMEWRHSKL